MCSITSYKWKTSHKNKMTKQILQDTSTSNVPYVKRTVQYKMAPNDCVCVTNSISTMTNLTMR